MDENLYVNIRWITLDIKAINKWYKNEDNDQQE